MTGHLTIRARAVGRTQPVIPDWSLPWAPECHPGGEPLTLRELITRIVREETAAFRQRQREQRLVRILTAPQIEEGLAKGRVLTGGRDLHQSVEDEQAVAAALQAFEDGLYLVILDGEEQRELERQVWLRPDSELVFLRLTVLAGA